MEYPVTIRIEIGPGNPGQLQPIQSGDGHKALIRALAELLSQDEITGDYVAEGRSGRVVAHVTPQRFHIGMGGELPATLHSEAEVTVRLEGTD